LPHEGDHRGRVTENVWGAETQDLVAGLDVSVLAPVVGSQAGPMDRTVIFDRQPMVRVVEVGTRDEHTALVVQGDLHSRTREAPKHEEQSESGLHWTFRGGFRVLDRAAELANTSSSRSRLDLLDADQSLVQRGIQDHDGLDQVEAAGEVDHSAKRGRDG
jgi:hypothetical protein